MEINDSSLDIHDKNSDFMLRLYYFERNILFNNSNIILNTHIWESHLSIDTVDNITTFNSILFNVMPEIQRVAVDFMDYIKDVKNSMLAITIINFAFLQLYSIKQSEYYNIVKDESVKNENTLLLRKAIILERTRHLINSISNKTGNFFGSRLSIIIKIENFKLQLRWAIFYSKIINNTYKDIYELVTDLNSLLNIIMSDSNLTIKNIIYFFTSINLIIDMLNKSYINNNLLFLVNIIIKSKFNIILQQNYNILEYDTYKNIYIILLEVMFLYSVKSDMSIEINRIQKQIDTCVNRLTQISNYPTTTSYDKMAINDDIKVLRQSMNSKVRKLSIFSKSINNIITTMLRDKTGLIFVDSQYLHLYNIITFINS